MKQRLFLFLFSLVVLFPLVYVFGTDIMEARNLISAQSMAQDGDWLIPHLYTEIRLNKPPLPVWLTAPIFLLNPAPSLPALHVPVILITSLLGIFSFELHRMICGESRANLYAGIVAASMLMTIKLGTTNSWDMYSVVFMAGSLTALLRTGRAWLAAGVLFMAASILSKGPVQMYTMLLPFLAALLLFRRELLSWKRLAVILTGGCLLGGLWYAYVYVTVPHIAVNVAQGEVSAWSDRHTASFFFYLSFPAFAGAWALPALAALGGRWLDLGSRNRADLRLLLCWFLLSLLLLSLVPEKKERYLMPALVPLALLAGSTLLHWVKGWKEKTLSRLERRIILAHIGLGASAAAGICLFIAWNNRDVWPYALFFALLSSALGFYGFRRPQYIMPVSCLILLCVVFAAYRMGSHRPVVQKVPPSCSLEELRSLPRLAMLPFYSMDGFSPTEEWETGRDITRISSPADVPEQRFALLDTDTTPPECLREGASSLRTVETFLIQTSRNRYMTLFIVEKNEVSSGTGGERTGT